MLQTALIILAVVISILLIIVVLIQKSKGGGLASNFAGSNQLMGVRRTNNVIENATWTFAIIVCVLSLASGMILSRSSNTAAPLVKEVPVQPQPAIPYETETGATEEGIQATPAATEEASAQDAAPATEEATDAPAQD